MLDFPLRTFIYNIEHGKYSDAMAKGWQALAYLSQIAPTNTNRASVVGSGRNSDALYNRLGVTFVNNDKVNDITGDENIKKAYAVILTSPGTPVVNYSDLTNSNLNDNILRLIKIRHWAGVKNTSAFMTSEDKNYNNAYDYHIQGDFAELKVVVGDEAYVANYEKNGNNGETTGGSADRNGTKFGGDGYNYTLLDEGTGWRVWYRNNNNADAIHVALSPESGYKTGTVKCTGQVIGIAGSGVRNFAYTTDGTAPVLNASNTKTVTYTWNSTTQSGKVDDFSSTHATVVANGGYVTVIAQAIKDGKLVGALDTVTYRFNDYVPLNVKLTPKTATVAYGASLTPKVEVTETDATTRTYAYTTDGTAPTIDTTTGKATGTTKVVTYTYDSVIPTNDLGTFYMAPGNVLTFIDNEGKTSTLSGNTVTVKAQAKQTVTEDEGSKYRLDGNVATGNYTFEEAGVQPGSSYTISIKNENEGTTPSINKAIADVTVINSTTKADDGVDVYYTTDGSDPLKSTSARLVRDRKVTVYALSGEVGDAGTIKVAIPGTTASASCTYDITYSTSEGGYQNYLNNSASTDKTLGGEGHVVVYVQPYNSDKTYTTSDRQTYVYAYEKKSDGTYASLTPAHRVLADADKTTVNSETWYALDLVPVKDYKEVNVQMGYYNTSDETYKTSDATVANACQDMFLKFDVATGQITDVTRANTGDHFYTIGDNGTKKEAANPVSGKPFFYAQVPLTWTSNSNSLKVFKGETELSDAKVEVQNGAETSDLSSVCKISVPTSLTEKTELTIKPYKGTTPSNVSFTITYQNGGYYFYESAKHYSPTAPLVFSADTKSDADYRSYGRKDINHVTTGDKTHYLANSWTYNPTATTTTNSVNDNWNGASSATVNVIPAGTTISQTVTGLTEGTPYTVQMIVRGKSGATGKLSLNEATDGTATDSKSFTGYNAAGTITTDGRVEALLSGTNNGWQKLEATANASTDGKLTISLAATGAEMELSDVTLLEKANINGHVWTTVPTSNEKTDYDLSDRKIANAFSFFDRGHNKNAIVYANGNTVLGMSPNTYDVAVSNGSTYTMHKLALTDQAEDGTTASGDVAKFYASGWNYGVSKQINASAVQFDRTFSAGVKAAVCFPFALDKDKMESMFGTGAKAYTVTAVDPKKMTVTVDEATSGISANTPCLIEPGSSYTVSNNLTGSFDLPITSGVSLSTPAGTGYTFEGTYEYKKVFFNDQEHCYSFDPTLNGRFKYVSKSKGGIIKPFRAYIKEANTGAKAKVFRLVINNTTTGLVDAELNEVSTAPIYSVTGAIVSVNGNKNGLPKGVYIQEGKKFVINK